MVPILSKLYKAGDIENFRLIYNRKLWQVSIIGIVGLLLLGVLGRSALDLLVGYGNITTDNEKELWWVMIWLGGMFIGGLGGQICSSTFYACGNTKTPTQMSMLTYTVYIPCKVAAFYFWGVAGLGIATSIYYMTNLLLLVYLLKKEQTLWIFQHK